MQKIREWGFPVVLIVVWMIAAAYTLSLMFESPRASEPRNRPDVAAEFHPS
jgi:hypothetical protein